MKNPAFHIFARLLPEGILTTICSFHADSQCRFRKFAAIAFVAIWAGTTGLNPCLNAAEEHWDTEFGFPGFNGQITGIAPFGDSIYVAGSFGRVGPLVVTNLVQWDGKSWSLPGGPRHEDIIKIASGSSGVYLAEGFASTDYPVSIVWRWDGLSWSVLGRVEGTAMAIGVTQSGAYIGGLFTSVNSVQANNIAQWDGTHWSALGGGLNGGVNALIATGTNLYAGGRFDMAGGSAAANIAVWDGSHWLPLSNGVDWPVTALAGNENELYAGGRSTLARWQGGGWSRLGTDLVLRTIAAIALFRDELYITGDILLAGQTNSVPMARWKDGHWSAFGTQFASGVSAMESRDDLLYVAGGVSPFETPKRVFEWNGTFWASLDSGQENGLQGTPNALAVNNQGVFAGGNAIISKNLSTPGVARWNGTNWSALREGISGGTVLSLATSGSNLYVGGAFTTDTGSGGIAKWNGSNWSDLGRGVARDNTNIAALVESIAVAGTNVYVGGYFQNAGSLKASGIARWDGNEWNNLGPGVGGVDAGVALVLLRSNDVFVAGSFTTAGTTSTKNIARWDGNTWSPLAEGIDGRVITGVLSRDKICFGGTFSMAGTTTANNVAFWDGRSWTALADGLNGPVFCLVSVADDIYASGFFTRAGGITANGFARWDGTRWWSLDNSISGAVGGMVIWHDDLFMAGGFAGAPFASGVAAWHLQPALRIIRSIGNVTVNWPKVNSEFALEFRDGLSGGWAFSDRQIELVDENFVIREPSTNITRFYRLRKN